MDSWAKGVGNDLNSPDGAIAYETTLSPTAGDLSAAVTFTVPLHDTDYEVSPTANFGAEWAVTSKTVNGFTLEWNNAAPSGASIFLRVRS